MTNMITAWKKHAKERRRSVCEGVRHMNLITGAKLTPSAVDEMEKGIRAVPVEVQRYIINVMLNDLINSARTFDDLLSALLLPKRVKK